MWTVGEVMIRSVLTIRPETTIGQAVNLMTQYRITSLPVVDQDQRLLGLISDYVLMRTVNEPDLINERVGQHMTRDVMTIEESTSLYDVATILREHRLRRLPVLKDDRLVGLVSRTHLMKFSSQCRAQQVRPDTSTVLSSAKPLLHLLTAGEQEQVVYRRLIENSFGNGVTLEFSTDAKQTDEWVTHNQCDLLLLDLDNPGITDLSVIDHARERNPGTQVILIATHADWTLLSSAMQKGASGLLLKPLDPLELVDIVGECFNRWQRWARAVTKAFSLPNPDQSYSDRASADTASNDAVSIDNAHLGHAAHHATHSLAVGAHLALAIDETTPGFDSDESAPDVESESGTLVSAV